MILEKLVYLDILVVSGLAWQISVYRITSLARGLWGTRLGGAGARAGSKDEDCIHLARLKLVFLHMVMRASGTIFGHTFASSKNACIDHAVIYNSMNCFCLSCTSRFAKLFQRITLNHWLLFDITVLHKTYRYVILY